MWHETPSPPVCFTYPSSSASLCTSLPGTVSATTYFANAGAANSFRIHCIPPIAARLSVSSLK